MRRIGALAVVAAALVAAALAPSDPAGAGLGGVPLPPPLTDPSEPAAEPDTLVSYGEYADGGARVEVIDLETGRRRVIEDTKGDTQDDAHGAAAPSATAASGRCTNSDEFSFLGGVDRYWHQVEAWTFNPTGNPGADAPQWRDAIRAASDVWQNTTNACGLPDTVGWVTPTTWTDDSGANVPKNNCIGNNSDGKNTFGWRAFDNEDFVAWACVFRSGTWVIEGDVGFNTLIKFGHNDPPVPGEYDVQSVALHEWGHILGLGHSCEWGSGTDPCDWDTPAAEAVMFPSLVGHQTLSAGDIEGAEALYPTERGYEISAVTLINDVPGHKLAPGHRYTIHADLKNTGMRAWKVDDPAYVLATLSGAASEFADAGWITPSTATRIDGDRTNGPDNNAQTIVRDEVARLTFTVTMPLAREGQTPSLEAMGLRDAAGAVPGGAVTELFDVGTFASLLDDQVSVPVVVQGTETVDVWVDLENTGTAPWFVNEVLTLAASDGAGNARCSALAGSNWSGCQTASFLDENASRTVLPLVAPSALPVKPGEVGRFKFRFGTAAPGTVTPGLYAEVFEAKAHGGRFVGSPTTFDLVVL